MNACKRRPFLFLATLCITLTSLQVLAGPKKPKDLPINTTYDPSEQAQITLNGLEALTTKILPTVSEKYNASHFEYTLDLPVYVLSALKEQCYDLSTSLHFAVDIPIQSDSVTAEFKEDKLISSHWNLEDGEVQLDVVIGLTDLSDSWKCWGWDIANFILGDEHTVKASGITGGIDTSVKLDNDSTLQLDKIEKIDLTFNNITFSKSEKLNWLADNVTKLGPLFENRLGFTCTSPETCVNAVLDLELNKGGVKKGLVALLNTALGFNLSVEGGVSEDILSLDYDVALYKMRTHNQALRTTWKINLSSEAIPDACATELEEATYKNNAPVIVGSDIDVSLPYSLIMKPLYLASQQGVFCADLQGSLSQTDASTTINHIGGTISLNKTVNPITPAKLPFQFDYMGVIVPSGIMEISSSNKKVYVKIPFRSGLDITVTHQDFSNQANEILDEASDKADDLTSQWDKYLHETTEDALDTTMNRTKDFLEETSEEILAEYVDETNHSDIAGMMVITTELNVNCNNGLYLNLQTVNLENITGELNLGFTTIPAKDFSDSLSKDVEKSINQRLPTLTLLPKIVDLADTSLGIEIDKVITEDLALGIGVNIVEIDENCNQ